MAERRQGTVTDGVADSMIEEEDMLSATIDAWLPPGPHGWWERYNATLQAEAAQLRRQRELGGEGR